MAQVINTNVQSLNAQRNLNNSALSLATSLQRLSSGLRINSAKDDAAGLAISERFTTQIRGLNVAVRNANDGISLSQTAEGALGEISNNLQRIRELAVQARNATNSASDRAALNAEVQQRLAEIERTASQTSFNGQKILDGSFGKATFQVGSNAGETISLNLDSSTRANNIGKIAEAVSNALGATATGGSNSITPTNLLFGTAGTADGSLDINASNRLFGETGVSDGITFAQVDLTATVDGSNTQSVTTFDYSGAGLAQFDVTIGANTVGVTLNADYTDATGLAAAIQAQVQLGGGDLATTTVTADANGNIFFEGPTAAAVEIEATDANAQAAGFADDGGVAGGTPGAVFSVDGIQVTLNNDFSAAATADLTSALQTALNTVAAGTYTVSDNGTDVTITNNNAGSGPVEISGGNSLAQQLGFVDSVGTTAANTNTQATFTVGDGTNTANITLDQNYTSFGDEGDTTSLLADLQTQLGANFTASFENGTFSISSALGDPVEISAANARAAAAGFGNQAGVVTTNASFDVDGTTVTLDQDYADADALAADIGSQLGSGYTVANDAGTITITNNTLGSAGVVIANADANAQAAGIADSEGTAGIGAGTVTLASGGLTILDGTGKTSTFSGTYDSVQALADDINTNANGVFASATADGKLQLQSALAFTVGGSDAASFGFGSAEVATTDGSLNDVNVLTTGAADEAIVRIDSALQSVSSLRSDFGAIQNRFESTIANLQGTAENLAASRSRILDADFAAETANLTRAQILQQAGVAILAQANQLPQNVLSLLR